VRAVAPLDSRRDFRDDGGTPAWRRRRTVTIDGRALGLKAFIRRTPLWKILLWVFFIGYILPMIVLISGIVGGTLASLITR
jgi:hypothetical protein